MLLSGEQRPGDVNINEKMLPAHTSGRGPITGNHPERLPPTLNATVRSYRRTTAYEDPTVDRNGDNPAQNGTTDPQSKQIGAAYQAMSGPRSSISYPKNYIPLPAQRQEWGQALSIMNGAGHNLNIEWEGERPRLQEQHFKNERDRQLWRQAEWRRQKSRRRFSNFTTVQDVIGKQYSTNESAQAAFSQKQFKRPSSENKFYALLTGMSALFGTIE